MCQIPGMDWGWDMFKMSVYGLIYTDEEQQMFLECCLLYVLNIM